VSAARATDDAFQDVLLALFRLHGQVLHAADVMSADAGLSGARWQVMKVVSRRPMTVSQVARRLGLQRQSVQRTADGLREQGLAEVLPVAAGADRRIPTGRHPPQLPPARSYSSYWQNRPELAGYFQSYGRLRGHCPSGAEQSYSGSASSSHPD
jgi:DNA-binding transcriptional ArsR family regulator